MKPSQTINKNQTVLETSPVDERATTSGTGLKQYSVTLNRQIVELCTLQHTNTLGAKCKKCKQMFSNADHLITENMQKYKLITVLPNREITSFHFVCVLCCQVLREKQVMEKHLLEHVKKREMGCPKCQPLTVNVTLEALTITSPHFVKQRRSVRCGKCRVFLCTFDDFVNKFTDTKLLNVVVNGIKTIGKYYYSCHICGKTFSEGRLIKKHMTEYVDSKEMLCVKCKQEKKSSEIK